MGDNSLWICFEGLILHSMLSSDRLLGCYIIYVIDANFRNDLQPVFIFVRHVEVRVT